MTDEVAKGVNFVFAKEYILKQYGEEVWQRALAHLPKEQATLWSGALVPFGAYSFPAFKATTAASTRSTRSSSSSRTRRS
jgi:hypothetical protein